MAVNLATDLKDSGWAWLAVGVLTAVSAAVSLYVSWSSAEPARDADLDEILETLTVTSESMWSRALRHRGLKVEQLIDVPWDAIPHGRSNGDRHRTITGPLRARTTSEHDIKDTVAWELWQAGLYPPLNLWTVVEAIRWVRERTRGAGGVCSGVHAP